MSKSDKFFQFPTALLHPRYSESHHSWMDYGVYYAGYYAKVNDEPITSDVEEWEEWFYDDVYCLLDSIPGHTKTMEELTEDQIIMLVGTQITGGLKWGSFRNIERSILNVRHLLEDFPLEKDHWSVRVRTDFLWKAINKGFSSPRFPEVSDRRFRVFCAVMALLGKKQYEQIARKRIAAAAHGLNSPKDLEPKYANKAYSKAGLKSVSEDCQFLAGNGFFAMLTPPARESYFSNRLQLPELKNEVVKSEKAKTEKIRAKEMRELNKEIQNELNDSHIPF